jgi:hypothetical protein
MIIAPNTGNEMREAAALMLAENIMSLNPKFNIEIRKVDRHPPISANQRSGLQGLWARIRTQRHPDRRLGRSQKALQKVITKSGFRTPDHVRESRRQE